jgi:hypothetical protein
MNQILELPQIEAEDVTIDFDELLRATRPRPTRLKLSEAIRAGSLLTDPFNNWFEARLDGQAPPRACAIGAACYVMNGETNPGYLNIPLAAEWFPELLEPSWPTPEQAPELFAFYHRHYDDPEKTRLENAWDLGDTIIFLNDSLELPRERVANIVEAMGY